MTLLQASELATEEWAWLVIGTGLQARVKQHGDPLLGSETEGST